MREKWGVCESVRSWKCEYEKCVSKVKVCFLSK
jgi:hypothetical protein